MEVISIEATTFEEIKQALSSIIRDIRTGRGIRQEERLTEWMDNQEACIMMDISPRKVAYFTQHGKNPVQQDRQENLLPEKRHHHIHGRTVTKRKQLSKEIWHMTY